MINRRVKKGVTGFVLRMIGCKCSWERKILFFASNIYHWFVFHARATTLAKDQGWKTGRWGWGYTSSGSGVNYFHLSYWLNYSWGRMCRWFKGKSFSVNDDDDHSMSTNFPICLCQSFLGTRHTWRDRRGCFHPHRELICSLGAKLGRAKMIQVKM